MTDLVVIVPGITGSVLRRPDGTDVWRKSLVTAGQQLFALPGTLAELTLPDGIGDQPPDAAHRLDAPELITGWHLWPGMHTGDGYHELIARLGRAAPDAVRGFPYDWRLSNRCTAARLATEVDRWLDQWRASPGNRDAKVRFVCHSMGGLIVRYFLEVLGGRELTSRIITLGTPYSGAVKAVRVLTGDAYGRIPRFGDRLTLAAQSFPSMAQLLPSYHCHAVGNDHIGLADRPVPGLPTTLVTDGLAFHNEIAAAALRNGPPPYDVFPIAGTRSDTLQSFTSDGRGIHYRTEQRGTDHSGDGTVALFSAVPNDWDDTSRAETLAVRHAAMGVAESVLDAVWNKISPVRLAGTLGPAVELGLTVPDIATVTDGVEVFVRSDRRVRMAAELTHPETGDIVADDDMRRVGRDFEYATKLQAPEGLWRVTVRAVKDELDASASDLVLVV